MKRAVALALTLVLLLTTFAGCIKKTDGSPEPEDTSEYEALYAPVLKKYKQAFDEGWSREKFVENHLAPGLANLEKTAEPSFAFVDLDGDKTPELFIGRADEPADVYDLYTVDGETIRQLNDAANEQTLALTEDNCLIEDVDDYEHLDVTISHGMENGELTDEEIYVRDPDRIINGVDECYRTTEPLPKDEREIYDDRLTAITQEDYDKAAKDYERAELRMKEFEELDEDALTDSGMEIAAMESDDFLVPTEEDFKKLGSEEFFNYESTTILGLLQGTFFSVDLDQSGVPAGLSADFDSAALDTKMAKDYLCYMNYFPLYEFYFDDFEIVSTTQADGSIREYLKYSEENMIWIIKNVLNMQEEFVRDEFLPSTYYVDPEYDNAGNACQYKDGYYYFESLVFGEESGISQRIIGKEAIGAHRYKITIDYIGWEAPDEYDQINGIGTAIVELKEIDGRRVWSIYKYSAKLSYTGVYSTDMEAAMPDHSVLEQETSAPSQDVSYEEIYAPILEQYEAQIDGNESAWCFYAYHDIDEDGVPELLVESGQSMADNHISYYTIQGTEAVYLGKTSAGSFRDDDHAVVLDYSHTSLGYYQYISIEGDALNLSEEIPYTYDLDWNASIANPASGEIIDFVEMKAE